MILKIKPREILFLRTFVIGAGDRNRIKTSRYIWNETRAPRIDKKEYFEPLTRGSITIGIWGSDETYDGPELIEHIPKIRPRQVEGVRWRAVRAVTLTEMLLFEALFPEVIDEFVPEDSSSSIYAPQKEHIAARCDSHGVPRIFLSDTDEWICSENPVMLVFERHM